MIIAKNGERPRIVADEDMKGTYHLVGVDFTQLTSDDDQDLVDAFNVSLKETIEVKR